MPDAAPFMPRKMFPPPTTIATCTPRSTTDLIAAATARTRSGSVPYSSSPSNDSPEGLSRSLLNAGSPDVIGRQPIGKPRAGASSGLLAHREARETTDDDVL